MKKVLFILAFVVSSPALAQQPFYQGPGEIGHKDTIAGTVIGIHSGVERDCYLILADIQQPGWEGLGGAGRFFLCGTRKPLEIGQAWNGRVVQKDTRMARVGPKWRPIPVFEPR